MEEQQALDLQIWCYRNLSLNICVREKRDGAWIVRLGLPDGSEKILDGSPVRMCWAYVPGPNPAKAFPALVSDKDHSLHAREKIEPGVHRVVERDVPIVCLRGDTYPVLYDGLESMVLVFSSP
jgi:hypothetical protein